MPCHVPSASAPPITGTWSDTPVSMVFTCAGMSSGPSVSMNPAGRRGCKAIEPTCKIAAHVRIGILLNHQRSRRMPREEEQCTIFRPALGNEPHNFARNLGEGASTGVDHKCRSRNELGHAVGDWRQRTLDD